MAKKKKSRKKDDKWLSDAIKRPDRVRRLAAREGGLDKDGDVKLSWVNKRLKKTKDPSLKRALILAKRLIAGDLKRKKK